MSRAWRLLAYERYAYYTSYLAENAHEIIKQIRDFCGDAGIGRVTFPAGASAKKISASLESEKRCAFSYGAGVSLNLNLIL
jgi:hypothetical protein